AVRMLNNLSSEAYLNRELDFGGLLEHSVGAKPFNSEIDVHLNYADYYYLEALLKLQRIESQKQARKITLNQPAKRYQGIWYGIGETRDQFAYKYSGGLGTYPAKHRPMLCYSAQANQTYFTYGASVADDKTALFHGIGSFNHTTGKLSRPTLILNKETNDAHDNPVIAMDSSGYIWVFSTSHGSERPSYIHKSTRPFATKTFELVEATTEWNGQTYPFDNFSYAQVWNRKKEGFLMFSTRYSFPTNRTIGYQTSASGLHWSRFQPIAAFGEGHYQISGFHDQTFMTVFNYHPRGTPAGTGINRRTNLYYLETPDDGQTWRTVAGDKVALPLVDKENAALIHDYASEGKNVYLKDIRTDSAGNPIILYLTSKGAFPGPDFAPYVWHTAAWNGRGWEVRLAFESDHNYDMGSLFVYPDKWQVLAPTKMGKEAYAVGGEIVSWESRDRGRSWQAVQEMTRGSAANHSYVRRGTTYHPDFKAIWFDGKARTLSGSRLYYCNEKGNVFKAK
ncbi:MAG: BNR-4 repeat-containing protein, partial [Bacteroidota bacterium]